MRQDPQPSLSRGHAEDPTEQSPRSQSPGLRLREASGTHSAGVAPQTLGTRVMDGSYGVVLILWQTLPTKGPPGKRSLKSRCFQHKFKGCDSLPCARPGDRTTDGESPAHRRPRQAQRPRNPQTRTSARWRQVSAGRVVAHHQHWGRRGRRDAGSCPLTALVLHRWRAHSRSQGDSPGPRVEPEAMLTQPSFPSLHSPHTRCHGRNLAPRGQQRPFSK